jgi:DNA mismatch repair protein MutS
MTTPALRQYAQIRSSITDPNTILFFRMGDFYEMFFDDALTASRLLDITLTTRNKNDPTPVPLCGVPYHAAQGYIDKLLLQGKKVAICEQMEDPKTAKGVVKREITQIITPGVVLNGEMVGRASRYIVAVCECEGRWSLACADVSTGEFVTTEVASLADLQQELARKDPQEVLIEDRLRETTYAAPLEALGYLLTYYTPVSELPILDPRLRVTLTAGETKDAADLLWSYLAYTNRSPLTHFTQITSYQTDAHVSLDESTIRHLELVRAREPGEEGHTLLRCMDRTVTAMGARRLKHWILHPLRDATAIVNRQSMIAAFMDATTTHLSLRTMLETVSDMERIVGRVSTGFANARDVVALAQSLQKIPQIRALGCELPSLAPLIQTLQEFRDLAQRILTTLVDEPPLSLKEGGMIRAGVHSELDELRTIRTGGKQFIAKLETQERERTGISSLKVGFNRVFGYYLEITHSHRDKIPADYIRKQTLTNAERYITPELKQYEEKVLGAEERISALEYELFVQLREAVLPHISALQTAADALGTLDVIQGLALLARDSNYVRPMFVAENILQIEEGRHPVVEHINVQERFVPNDVQLTSEKPIAIITGPNMAGKSTVMRQTALITLIAHMGSFVPAKRATIGLVDRIFTRVGASDNLARGQSTFMVEMTEAAAILQNATAQSLIIIDEIGRGTSTFDGISIAWAVAEYLHDFVQARCLFATHYHELTDLPLTKPGMANFTMAVKEWNNEIIFLRKLIPGGANRSYGIQVARLAGLPSGVVERAREILGNLERGELNEVGQPRLAQSRATLVDTEAIPQLQLFNTRPGLTELTRLLDEIHIDTLTPIEALNRLHQMKKIER